ncbi:unnamed protein product [Mytilus edulis]|uniref:Uncharacterized protein n=1 Tax=Mytilus edulis TaxID=6550 RepID=A0A8S3PSJ5_MYTED|nr:unnamed protein product [Mytilus edulis]
MITPIKLVYRTVQQTSATSAPTTDAPSHSSPDNVENRPSVFSTSTQSSLEGTSKPTRLNITSGYTTTKRLRHNRMFINRQVMYYLIQVQITLSMFRINPSVLKDGKMLESTTGVSETPDSHHIIGVIIGALSAAVVIVVAVVLVAICRLRRLGPFMKRFGDDNPINDSNFQDVDDTSNQSSPNVNNTMYDIHTVSGDDTRLDF